MNKISLNRYPSDANSTHGSSFAGYMMGESLRVH